MKRYCWVTSVLIFLAAMLGCTAAPKPSEIHELQSNEEFEKIVHVRSIPSNTEESAKEIEKPPRPPAESANHNKPPKKSPVAKKTETKNKVEKKSSSQKKSNANSAVKDLNKHWPEMEDAEGFIGRRPAVDPFVIGEVLTYDVSYGLISAGKLQLKVHPLVEVNERKSYHFSTHAESNSVFSLFYEVKDWAESYVDFETLLPSSFSLHVRESKQYKEVRNFFDWQQLEGKHWEKRLKRGKMQEKKIGWKILPYSQNVISSFFYLRTFEYSQGKKMQFRVADDGKNLVTTVEVLGKEKISTVSGEIETTKSMVNFEYDGVFKPIGSVFLWMTEGPEKYIARIDAKIKIGTIRIEIEKIERPK